MHTSGPMSLRAHLVCALSLVWLGCGSISLGPDAGTGAGGNDAGATGAAGTRGQAGTSGSAGTTGSAGATGAAGMSGTGAAGTTGHAGTTGAAGTGGHGGTGAAGSGGCPGVCGNVSCPYGFQLDASGCSTCVCNPTPACTTEECGGPPPFAQPMCPNGKIIPPACNRNADGKCTWKAPSCLTVCPAIACPAIFCPYGNTTDPATGCPTCGCNPGPMCPTGSHAVMCSGVMCALACADGFKRGTDGCPVCACRAAATCAGPNVRCASCSFGYRTGPNGCTSCACEDPPMGCAVNAAGAP
jgi:hypothetical protein